MQQQRIQSGDGAARAVGVNEGNALLHGHQQGDQGVEAADLYRDGIVDGFPLGVRHFAQVLKGAVDVRSNADFLELRGRAHGGGAGRVAGVVHLLRLHHLDHDVGVIDNAVVFLELVQRHFAAFTGAAATASENGRTVDHIPDAVTVETKHIRTSCFLIDSL